MLFEVSWFFSYSSFQFFTLLSFGHMTQTQLIFVEHGCVLRGLRNVDVCEFSAFDFCFSGLYQSSM